MIKKSRITRFFARWSKHFVNILPWVGSVIGLALYFKVGDTAVEDAGIIGVMIVIGVCALFSGLVAAYETLRFTNIRVAQFSKLLPYTPIYLAQHYGYFRQEGIKIEFIKYAGGDRKTWDQVFSKEADIGMADPIAMLDEHADAGTILGSVVSKAAVWALTKNDSLTIADLKNPDVKVYIWDFTSTNYKIFCSFLRQRFPVESDEIISRIVEIEVGTELGALEADPCAVVLLTEPSATIALMNGAKEIFSAPDILSNFFFTGLFARRDYVEQNRAEVLGFLSALQRALTHMRDNPGDAIDFAIREFGGDQKTILRSASRLFMDGVFPERVTVDKAAWNAALKVRFGSDRSFPFERHVSDALAIEAIRRVSPKRRRIGIRRSSKKVGVE